MFRWQFLPPDCKSPGPSYVSSLEATQFESSSYDAPASIYELERKVPPAQRKKFLAGPPGGAHSPHTSSLVRLQSKKGHMLLTNAVKTGRACVQAHLTQPLTQVGLFIKDLILLAGLGLIL